MLEITFDVTVQVATQVNPSEFVKGNELGQAERQFFEYNTCPCEQEVTHLLLDIKFEVTEHVEVHVCPSESTKGFDVGQEATHTLFTVSLKGVEVKVEQVAKQVPSPLG